MIYHNFVLTVLIENDFKVFLRVLDQNPNYLQPFLVVIALFKYVLRESELNSKKKNLKKIMQQIIWVLT